MDCKIPAILHPERPDNFFSRPLRAAILVSGSGSNAERLLRTRGEMQANWEPAAIVTDYPERSRAAALAAEFAVPLIDVNIKAFYSAHGLESTALNTAEGRWVRDLWSDTLCRQLAQMEVDFSLLAGFVSMTNLAGRMPCLNVHPGDLTIEENGTRVLTGLHTLPIETALLRGFSALRSSVILAQPYRDVGGDMDSGPILGISAPMQVNLGERELTTLREVKASRPAMRPKGGYRDALSEQAAALQERLKEAGDWIVFPAAVADFAAGNFALSFSGQLLYRVSGVWQTVRTVEYSISGKVPIL